MERAGNNYQYRIEGRDIDFSQRPSIMAITDYILRAAGEDADNKGFGIRELNLENSSWVLSRVAVEMDRLPLKYQTINIYTWVSEINRMMTTRNFIISDQDGVQIGAATTLWAMINLSTRLPMDLRSHTDYAKAIVNEPIPIAPAAKVLMCEPTHDTSHKVAYSDIDFNQHANSMKYIEWLVDMLPIEWHTEKQIARYDINYIHEARYAETLKIYGRVGSPSTFEIKNEAGIAICRAMIQFK